MTVKTQGVDRMTSTKKLTKTAFLIALGIIIPMVMPKITIPPASYTIASHVPVFIAMFISPGVAIAVSLGTAFGFLVSLPLVVAIRALSHLVFAIIGAMILKQQPSIKLNRNKLLVFNLGIAVVHATSESFAVAVFYLLSPNQSIDYFKFIFLLVGIGGFVHSILDFFLAQIVIDKTNIVNDFR